MAPLSVRFDRGTLRFSGEGDPSAWPGALWDSRTECFRAPAWLYGSVVDAAGDALSDEARLRVLPLDGVPRAPPLRAYQDHALAAWRVAGRGGVVVLPTGAGKTRVAVAAIAACSTATLVLCPTRALLAQWTAELREWYGGAIGVLGDGGSAPSRRSRSARSRARGAERGRSGIGSGFRDGTYGVVVSARVLNEGIDVPDASVAIVVGGDLGELEHIQRVGRTLRPAPGKRAVVYELVTARTVDDQKARRRGGSSAARAAVARP